jgi:NAD(P)H dehydrogenase (quinone)
MHLLAVYAHPLRQAYAGAILDAFLGGLTEAVPHTCEVADLYREGFEMRLQPEDYAQFRGGSMPEEIRREQARVDRADALAFVFPVWWWSFPAILKGLVRSRLQRGLQPITSSPECRGAGYATGR